MSGRVLDENDAPVSDAYVEAQYLTTPGSSSSPPSLCPFQNQFCRIWTRTNDRGEYEFEFEPQTWPGPGLYMGTWGVVFTFRGYDQDVQWVPVGASPAVRDLRLRARTIVAGASTQVTVEPTSSLCTDLEDVFAIQNRCELIIIESGPGTLNVEARASSGGPAPLMLSYTTGNYGGFITRPGPGVVSIPVLGGTYRILVGLPDGAPAQRFTVITSLR